MKNIKEVYPLLEEGKKNIVITTHYGPDGDAIGSSLALQIYLQSLGHQVHTIIPSKCPEFLTFLPATDSLINYEAEKEKADALIVDATLIFGLDYNVFYRTRDMEEVLLASPVTKVLIDHHMHPAEDQFEYGDSDIMASSTCELVYRFIKNHGGEEVFTMDMMKLIYTGTVTDTGSFRFDRASGDLHRMVAFFKDKGLQHTALHEQLFDTWSVNRLKFLGHILAQRLEVFPEKAWSMIYIPQEDFDEFSVTKEDIEGFVNYGLSLKGIDRTVLLSQRGDGEVRLSFRGNEAFDVRTIASEYFDGGGHKNAAGGTYFGTIEEAINYFKSII